MTTQTLTLSYVNGLLDRHPDKVPVIVNSEKNNATPFKLLVSPDLTMGDFLNMLRNKKLNNIITKNTSLFLYVHDPANTSVIAPSLSNKIGNIYQQYQQPNKTLMVTYAVENVFG